jgi:hypothetical protein
MSADVPKTKAPRADTPINEDDTVEQFTTWEHPLKWSMPSNQELQEWFAPKFAQVIASSSIATTLSSTCFCAFVIHEAEKFLHPYVIEQCPASRANFERVLKQIFTAKAVDTVLDKIEEEGELFGRGYARRRYIFKRPLTMWISHIAETMIGFSRVA